LLRPVSVSAVSTTEVGGCSVGVAATLKVKTCVSNLSCVVVVPLALVTLTRISIGPE
jgi:hypothetical protein